MGTYDSFKSNEKHETEGVRLDLGDAGVFIVARAGGGNKRFTRRMEAVLKPHRRQIQAGTMDNDLATKLLCGVYAETIVVGWEGVTDENGEDLPYSVEAAKKLLNDLPDLRAEIQATAQDAAVYRSEVLEADAGN